MKAKSSEKLYVHDPAGQVSKVLIIGNFTITTLTTPHLDEEDDRKWCDSCRYSLLSGLS